MEEIKIKTIKGENIPIQNYGFINYSNISNGTEKYILMHGVNGDIINDIIKVNKHAKIILMYNTKKVKFTRDLYNIQQQYPSINFIVQHVDSYNQISIKQAFVKIHHFISNTIINNKIGDNVDNSVYPLGDDYLFDIIIDAENVHLNPQRFFLTEAINYLKQGGSYYLININDYDGSTCILNNDYTLNEKELYYVCINPVYAMYIAYINKYDKYILQIQPSKPIDNIIESKPKVKSKNANTTKVKNN